MLRAQSAMNISFTSVTPTTTIENAAFSLLHTGDSAALVLGENSELIGIITEYQMLQLAFDADVKTSTVGEFMTKEVLTANADDSLAKVANLFVLHRIRVLPVLDEGRLVGIISRSGIIHEILLNHLPIHPAAV